MPPVLPTLKQPGLIAPTCNIKHSVENDANNNMETVQVTLLTHTVSVFSSLIQMH